MAEDTGKGSYGTVHVMEEEMRSAEAGVFESKSGERRRARKAETAPANKAEGPAPENKGIIGADSFDPDGDGRVGGAPKGGNKRKARK